MPARKHLTSLFVTLLLACGGGDTTAPGTITVDVSPDRTLLVEIGGTVRFDASVWGASGQTITWTSSDPSIATVAAGVATAVSAGQETITASVAAASGSAQLDVYIAPEIDELVPGATHLGRGGYAELIVGELPLVISAPHGGELTPSEIPDRTSGVTGNDLNTQELTRALRDALIERTGRAPHTVVSRLRRIKLDPNREVVEAAQGNVFAENAWTEYHGFIDRAKERITADYGSGLYLDMHGHGHPIPRLELGYLLSASDLSGSDARLDGEAFAEKSSLRALHGALGIPFSVLIRGPTSLGTLMADAGVPSVPSAQDPAPGANPYFTGGYSTRRHGSQQGGSVSGIQIEHWFAGLRDTEVNRRDYAMKLADALVVFLEAHYAFQLSIASPASR